jgi:hypothetical protein
MFATRGGGSDRLHLSFTACGSLRVVRCAVLRIPRHEWQEERPVTRPARWLFACLAVGATGLAGAQTLVRSTVDAGGGVSAGAGYRLHGTIGQPDAQASAGGVYRLMGGFWVPTLAPQGDALFGNGFE